MPLESSCCQYDSLPLMDGFHWSLGGHRAGIRPVEWSGEKWRSLRIGSLRVEETAQSGIRAFCSVDPAGTVEIECTEQELVFRFRGLPADSRHALALTWSLGTDVPFVHVKPDSLVCSHRGHPYRVTCCHGHFEQEDDLGETTEHLRGASGILLIPESDLFVLKLNRQCTPGRAELRDAAWAATVG